MTVSATTAAPDELIGLLAHLGRAGSVRIHNARGGFACNSSSSHSIVILHPGAHAPSPIGEETPGYYSDEGFILATSEDKIRYLAAYLSETNSLTPDAAQRLRDTWNAAGDDRDTVSEEGSMEVPFDWAGDAHDEQFCFELAALIADDRVIVYGDESYGARQYATPWNLVGGGRAWRARRDTRDDDTWWVLFNTNDGTKLRISFDVDKVLAGQIAIEAAKAERSKKQSKRQLGEGPSTSIGSIDVFKAATPELVDVKLTDACPFESDCGFCFGGETEYLTRTGLRTLASTVNTWQDVLVRTPDGSAWVSSRIRSFGVQWLTQVTVMTDTGDLDVIWATAEHRWWVETPAGRTTVTTSTLNVGDTLSSLTENGAAVEAWTVKALRANVRQAEVFCAVVPEYENFTLAGNINVMNCYMGSTVKGTPGDVDVVTDILTSLAELKVFEVAFGGGEPSTWPYLEQTLSYARSLGITPNFTTKNFAWLTAPQAGRWLDLVGSVAFSVNNVNDLNRLISKLTKANLEPDRASKITIQLIPDLLSRPDFDTILKAAAQHQWRVTLLGYKHTGRGATFTPAFNRDPGWWLQAVLDARPAGRMWYGAAVAIDTLLAEQSKKALDHKGVPTWMYHLREGAFSCYIDAVTGRVGPSSYAGEDALTPLPLTDGTPTLTQAIGDAFNSYPGENG